MTLKDVMHFPSSHFMILFHDVVIHICHVFVALVDDDVVWD